MAKKNALYIVHGWSYSVEPWTATVSILRSKGFDVHQLRVPGLTAESSEVWDIDGYVEWLRAQLVDAERPIVLGHSNGGRISLNYLKKYPDSFDKLILLNAAGINVDNQKISLKRRLFRVVAKILRPLRYVPVVRRVAYRVVGGSDYERAPENMKKTLHNMLESDKSLDISDVNTRTTLMWGELDSVTPLSQGEKMARNLRESKLRRFSEWGHAPYITHPNELAAAIIEEIER